MAYFAVPDCLIRMNSLLLTLYVSGNHGRKFTISKCMFRPTSTQTMIHTFWQALVRELHVAYKFTNTNIPIHGHRKARMLKLISFFK